MRELIREINDPMKLSMPLTYEIFYMDNTKSINVKNNLFRLAGIAETSDYKFITAGNRPALDLQNGSAASVKLTYSLVPEYLSFDALNLGTDPFAWSVGFWIYTGPSDFTANLTTSNYNTGGTYVCTLNFINKPDWEQHTQEKRQLRLYIGRGSTSTLTMVAGRHRYVNGAWQLINRVKATNIAASKGWHLFFVKPLYATRSTLVWGFDKSQFSGASNFFTNTEDWTQDYWLGSDFCFSSSAKTSSQPRGPLRIFKRCEPASTFEDLYDNDVW